MLEQARLPAEIVGAAEHGLHLRRQHVQVKGLGDEIVRAHVQPQDFVRVLRFCGQDNNRQRIAFPDLHGCPDPVKTGHHYINDKKIHFFCMEDIQGFLQIFPGQLRENDCIPSISTS